MKTKIAVGMKIKKEERKGKIQRRFLAVKRGKKNTFTGS